MEIHVTQGIGSGPTELAAFDSALNDSGIENYNLLRLSSVIPPESKIVLHERGKVPTEGQWGDRLYVVMAEHRTSIPGVEAWAGIGWVADDETGKGLFVEHEGENKEQVEADIQSSLTALMQTRNVNFGTIHMKVAGTKCVTEPVCAMVVAAYKAEGW